jgi:hypothetical protein
VAEEEGAPDEAFTGAGFADPEPDAEPDSGLDPEPDAEPEPLSEPFGAAVLSLAGALLPVSPEPGDFRESLR